MGSVSERVPQLIAVLQCFSLAEPTFPKGQGLGLAKINVSGPRTDSFVGACASNLLLDTPLTLPDSLTPGGFTHVTFNLTFVVLVVGMGLPLLSTISILVMSPPALGLKICGCLTRYIPPTNPARRTNKAKICITPRSAAFGINLNMNRSNTTCQ